jgi:hypothetical protein
MSEIQAESPIPEIEAQRTLVKSPPELWALVSDPAILARQLGEFGEIKISRTEPETTVAWEGVHASGTVELEKSGWGTKVTLRARLAMPPTPIQDPPPAVAAPTPAPPPEPPKPQPARPAPAAEHRTTSPLVANRIEPKPSSPGASTTTPAGTAGARPPSAPPVTRARFLGRLWRRYIYDPPIAPVGVAHTIKPKPPASPVADQASSTPTPSSAGDASRAPAAPVELAAHPPRDPESSPSALEPSSVAAAAPDGANLPAPPPAAQEEPAFDRERAETVLSAALDDFGSAHHRPFSRG